MAMGNSGLYNRLQEFMENEAHSVSMDKLMIRG